MLCRSISVAIFVLAALPDDAATLKGVIRANEMRGEPMANVPVAADGANPTISDSFGKFTLEFPRRNPGDPVEVIPKREGYLAVNDVQLELALPADSDVKTLTIILCREEIREEMARLFYRLKSNEAIETTYQKELKVLEDEHRADATALANLQKERDQAKAAAEKSAEMLASAKPGQDFELYKKAMRLFLDNKLEEAIATLSDDNLRPLEEEADKAIEKVTQARLLKARLFTLNFRFEEALKSCETALRYINRESNPQLWAETEVDVGINHGELGIRVEGKAGNEHLAAAVTAYRSALEVYTREQLPQEWATTQMNLATALQEQGIRTGGPKAGELLAQAVAACRRTGR
jgi:tetratricopeptide (TPR) repeat protein